MQTVSHTILNCKRCTRCNETKSLECFYSKRRKPGELLSHCKDCMKADVNRRNRANPAAAALRAKKWLEKNPEKAKEIWKRTRDKYRVRNREKARLEYAEKRREKKRLYRQANAEKIKQRNAEYRASHQEAIKQYGKQYAAKNSKRIAESAKRCAAKKPELYRDISFRALARRRFRKLSNGRVEKFSHLSIFERDKWICHICGNPVDKTLRRPNVMCVSLDHIRPIAKGGEHTRANCACSHLRCNIVKKARYEQPPVVSGTN